MPECPVCKGSHPESSGLRLFQSENECPVCLEKCAEMMALPCGHQFCHSGDYDLALPWIMPWNHVSKCKLSKSKLMQCKPHENSEAKCKILQASNSSFTLIGPDDQMQSV